MGAALSLAADLIEDESAISGRAYRPAVILVSDGMPTDEWKAGLARFQADGRAQKSDRIALAIGADADEVMLAQFVSVYCPHCGASMSFTGTCPSCGAKMEPGRRPRVFRGEDAGKIKAFFRLVTMSVAARSVSVDPNRVPPMDDPFILERF